MLHLLYVKYFFGNFLFTIKFIFRDKDDKKAPTNVGTPLASYPKQNLQINPFTGLPYTPR
jgi:hypothetical protein